MGALEKDLLRVEDALSKASTMRIVYGRVPDGR